MIQRTIRVVTGVLAALAAVCAQAQQGEWRGGPTITIPTITSRVEGNHLVKAVDASPPVAIAVQSTPYTSMVGDDDGFGFGYGWIPPLICDVFDNAGPEDLGIFDRRPPNICNFVGTWNQPVPLPPGGAGALTLSLRILGGEGDPSQCFANPCGCAPPSPQLFINGVEQPGFFVDPGCASITVLSQTFTGAQANALASSGSLTLQVQWNNDPFAIDWSQVSVFPTTNGVIADGNGQKGCISNPVEKKLSVKVSSPDPSLNLTGQTVFFKVTAFPPKATGYGIGADDSAVTPTYSARVDANGMATATLVLGNVEGTYTVQATPSLSVTGPLTFTATAVKPNSVGILKDTTDIADLTPSYAVPSDASTNFFAVGLDKGGQKIGPMKCDWSLASSGSGATRGNGSVTPTSAVTSTTFSPSKVGQITLSAKPSNVNGVSTGSADLYVTTLYVSVDNSFSTNQEDQRAKFVPGEYLDGTDVPLSLMEQTGQFISLHVLTGPGAKGNVTFAVDQNSVSHFPGIAMNYPPKNPSTDADMAVLDNTTNLAASTTSVQFAPNGDTWVTLLVRDYAARGTINIGIKTGKKTYQLAPVQLPVDNGSGLPAAGWHVLGNPIASTNLTADGDVDNSNPQTGVGDGFSNFEEYRGFVIGGEHQRLDPRKKDVFVDADEAALTIFNGLPILTSLPLNLHFVNPDEVGGGTDWPDRVDRSASMADPNHTGVPGARLLGQRSVRLVYQDQHPPMYEDPATGALYEVWRVNLLGIALPDEFANVYVLNTPGNLEIIHSPDYVQFVEVYPQVYENLALHGDFSHPYYDVNGNVVPDCATVGSGVECDDRDATLGVIKPHPIFLPALNASLKDLHSRLDPNLYPGEYYSNVTSTCSGLSWALTLSQMETLKEAEVGHEFGHALDMHHTAICPNLMLGDGGRTLANTIPIPTTFTDANLNQILLYEP